MNSWTTSKYKLVMFEFRVVNLLTDHILYYEHRHDRIYVTIELIKNNQKDYRHYYLEEHVSNMLPRYPKEERDRIVHVVRKYY